MLSTATLRLFRTWRGWLLVTAVAEVAWFALLYPAIPQTRVGLVVVALLLVPVVGYWYLVARLVVYVADRPLTLWVRQAVFMLIALSAGAFLGGAWFARAVATRIGLG
jgi:hypothetical protein